MFPFVPGAVCGLALHHLCPPNTQVAGRTLTQHLDLDSAVNRVIQSSLYVPVASKLAWMSWEINRVTREVLDSHWRVLRLSDRGQGCCYWEEAPYPESPSHRVTPPRKGPGDRSRLQSNDPPAEAAPDAGRQGGGSIAECKTPNEERSGGLGTLCSDAQPSFLGGGPSTRQPPGFWLCLQGPGHSCGLGRPNSVLPANSRDLWYPKATESKASPVSAGALGVFLSGRQPTQAGEGPRKAPGS